jgi:NAD(P)-dependent dehydrogenase (short-subunit alcohol dehydrogenase family)
MTNPGDLAGHIALVTGGGRGIGRAIALALAAAGADVLVTARSAGEIEAVASEARALGVRAAACACDVTDPEQVARLAATAQESLGTVDILVNNAGLGGSHKFIGHDDALWHRMLAANLTSAYYVSKALVPPMAAKGWGRIVNIASIAAKVGGRYIAAYTASKHGLLGLTRALAVELVPYHITVNAICPGYVDTPMTDAAVANIVERTQRSAEEARQTLERLSPQNRLVTPEEVAHVALMLAGENGRGITGQAINVDGGTVMF